MANKDEFIKHCRYYRGGDENPNSDIPDMAWYWDMERVYVEHEGKFDGEEELYKNIGGMEYPGIPHSLLIIMFTSWAKQEYDIKKNIDSFYKLIDDYLSIANDYFAEDKIPNSL